MDIRISPSKLGNRYVLGRAGKDIRNITGSLRIDGFAKGIISRYEKPDETDLPRTQMEFLKKPQLPEALADIQDIINELLIINRSHTDIENAFFRNISIENNILRINMLLSRLESSNEYKEIRQGLEHIYRTQMDSILDSEEEEEGKQLELPLDVMTEKGLEEQIESILIEGGIRDRELIERIMGPSERSVSTEREELIHQPDYIPMNTRPLGQWKSQEARNFFWRVQRLERQDRELVLRSLGNISLSRLETILSEMDSQSWYKYSSSIAENIRLYMMSQEAEPEEGSSLMAEPVPAESYYSQLLTIIGSEEELTPELFLEEKENLIKFLQREDTDTERIRTEVVRILNDIHRNQVFTPSDPDRKHGTGEVVNTGESSGTETAPVIEELTAAEAREQSTERELEARKAEARRRAVQQVIEDISHMTVSDFRVLYDRIIENVADMPQDIVERLMLTSVAQGTELTEQDIELERENILNFLKKSQTEKGYYSDVLLSNIVRADAHRIRNYRSASEIAETTMNLSIAEWQRFTSEVRQLSEKSELSRRYIRASEEAKEAAEKAAGKGAGIAGAENAKPLSPELREQVESTREKMIFITQLDKAYKEGIDIFEEGDLLSESSVFSRYIFRKEKPGETVETVRERTEGGDELVEYSTKEELRTLGETVDRRITEREAREERLREELLLNQSEERSLISQIENVFEGGDLFSENSVFSKYIFRKEKAGETAEAVQARKETTRALIEYLTRENLKTLSETINQRITEREAKEEKIREELLLTQSRESSRTSQIETVLEERELIHPDLRVRRIRSSMEPMLEELQGAPLGAAAVEQAITYLEKRRDARTGEVAMMQEIPAEAPVELVPMHRAEPASRDEIEEIKKTAQENKRRLDENTTDIEYIKGGTQRTEITNESVVDMKALREKLTTQENEIEKIKEIQERLISAGKSDSYYTQKTITKFNDQLRMERLRRGF